MGVEGNIGDTEHPAVLPGVDFQSALVQVSLSGANGCALEETGAVHCWGTTHSGMLGFAWDGENLGVKDRQD
jgi:hypothetical protein